MQVKRVMEGTKLDDPGVVNTGEQKRAQMKRRILYVKFDSTPWKRRKVDAPDAGR
jgi:hypothetical protein